MPNTSSTLRARWGFFALAILAIVLDQVTKWVVIYTIPYQSGIEVLPFFNLVHVHNYGAAFSFLSDASGWQRWFFTGLAVVFSVVVTVWILRLKQHEWSQGWGLALILGGAIGNLIDRMYFGYVIDFLDVYYKQSHYPAFNVADSAICVGAAWLILTSFKQTKA